MDEKHCFQKISTVKAEWQKLWMKNEKLKNKRHTGIVIKVF